MNFRLTMMAVLASLAFGLGLSAPAGATAAIGTSGAVKAASNTDAIAAGSLVEQVRDHYRERGRYDGRRHEGRRHWRGDRDHGWRGRERHSRHDRRWDRDHRWDRHDRWERRHYRGRPNVYFHFGLSAPRYVEPRYVQPRYVAPRRVVRLTHAHYNWCHSRYRSYRASDNSFNPGHGMPRRQCISPYS